MDIRTFKKSLPFLIKNDISAFVWGSQGIGKTQTVSQYAKENDLELIVLHTATQDVGDLIGLLVKDEEHDVVRHSRPEWFPTSGKGIVFLDELNRAPNDVIQALFPFVTEGRLHTHILPPGWYVMGAGNYQNDRFTVTDTSDAAWLSRFCHVDFTPTTEEWIVYAESKSMAEISCFVREQPSMLELSAKDAGRLDSAFIVPDRRAWMEGIGRLEQENSLDEDIKYELYSGIIGKTAAAAFLSWKKKAERSLSLTQILNKYEGNTRKRVKELSSVENEKRFDILNQPLDELFVKLELTPHLLTGDNCLDNLKLYLFDIPRELSMKAFTRMAKIKDFAGKREILNDPEYVGAFK